MKMTDFCAYLHNWFDISRSFGTFTIKDGSLVIGGLQKDQFFRIIGSVFNDGVYQYPATGLTDEVFTGAVWFMAVPPDAIELVSAMTDWETANAEALNSPYSSESFGGYSYTKASGGNTSGGDGTANAFTHFAAQLSRWRKVRDM